MVFVLLVQAHSLLDLGACKDLLNTAKEVHPFFYFKNLKPFSYFAKLSSKFSSTMSNIWGSAFDVSTFILNPSFYLCAFYLINPSHQIK